MTEEKCFELDIVDGGGIPGDVVSIIAEAIGDGWIDAIDCSGEVPGGVGEADGDIVAAEEDIEWICGLARIDIGDGGSGYVEIALAGDSAEADGECETIGCGLRDVDDGICLGIL